MERGDLSSRLAQSNVSEIPNTPPLNKFGGTFENGWEIFFSELNTFLSQLQSVQQSGGIYINRNGMVVTLTGSVGREPVNVGIPPVVPFAMDGVSVDSEGNVNAPMLADGVFKTFSLSYIAKEF